MSNVYSLEPPVNGKVVLKTTHGTQEGAEIPLPPGTLRFSRLWHAWPSVSWHPYVIFYVR